MLVQVSAVSTSGVTLFPVLIDVYSLVLVRLTVMEEKMEVRM